MRKWFAAFLIALAGCGQEGGSGGTTLNLNLFLVAMDDGAAKRQTMVDEMARLMANGGIAVGGVTVYSLTGDDASRLTFLDEDTDTNQNGIPDDMEELFQMSSAAVEANLNIFFVRSISGFGTLGIAGDIPGPGANGTITSGVVVNTFGGLADMTQGELVLQGATMAHEGGHYLGLYHTTESGGTLFDPISDTPECSRAVYDTNGDGIVSSRECKEVDGPNLMFWSAASYAQETISDGQAEVWKGHPLVR